MLLFTAPWYRCFLFNKVHFCPLPSCQSFTSITLTFSLPYPLQQYGFLYAQTLKSQGRPSHCKPEALNKNKRLCFT